MGRNEIVTHPDPGGDLQSSLDMPLEYENPIQGFASRSWLLPHLFSNSESTPFCLSFRNPKSAIVRPDVCHGQLSRPFDQFFIVLHGRLACPWRVYDPVNL